jgi:hypothetical protein
MTLPTQLMTIPLSKEEKIASNKGINASQKWQGRLYQEQVSRHATMGDTRSLAQGQLT